MNTTNDLMGVKEPERGWIFTVNKQHGGGVLISIH
jgi:hypothetical protein